MVQRLLRYTSQELWLKNIMRTVPKASPPSESLYKVALVKIILMPINIEGNMYLESS
jgi:hypothetical protein